MSTRVEVMLPPTAETRSGARRRLHIVRAVFLPLIEAAIFMACGLLSFDLLDQPLSFHTALLAGSLFAAITGLMRGYAAPLLQKPHEDAGRIGATVLLAFAICLAGYGTGFGDTEAPTIVPFLVWAVAAAATIVCGRSATAMLIARQDGEGALTEEVVVLTREPASLPVQQAGSALAARLGADVRLRLLAVPAIGDEPAALQPLVDDLRQLEPSEVLVDLQSMLEPSGRAQLLAALASLPSRVWITVAGGVPPHVPQLAVLLERPMSDSGLALKRAFDVFGSLLLLVCVGPLLLVIAAAIKLDSPGSVIFKQRRLGYNNQMFDIYKFRSMHEDKADAHGGRLTVRGDPRVTRVGRFIRRASIDELPQLFNVLKGDMSLVGPRPHPLRALAGDRPYAEVVPDICRRHRLRPGITGLAQINGYRGNTDTEEKLIGRVQYDFQYIDNWSFWLDLQILVMTPFSGMLNENAY